MKYFPKKAFPYPVLPDNLRYNDDYQEAADFQKTISLKSDNDEGDITLTASFDINEKAILERIGKSAAYAVHVLCAKTNYRCLLRADVDKLTHVFKSRELYDDVVLTACVVCTDRIKDYHSPNFHPEFGKAAAFDMPQGAVLAIATPDIFSIDAVRPLGSIFKLNEDPQAKKGLFDFNDEEDIIIINMHPSDYQRVIAGRKSPSTRKFLIMSVYLPVLMEVLRAISPDNDGGNHEGKMWYRTIQAKLDEHGIKLDGNNIHLHAQRLWQMPLAKLPLMKEEE